MGIAGWVAYWVTIPHSKLTSLRRAVMPSLVCWWLALFAICILPIIIVMVVTLLVLSSSVAL